MASFNKFQQFVQDIGRAVLNLNSDTLRDLLTNTVPNTADIKVDTTATPCTIASTSNASEIAAGNGYTKKGTAIGSNAYSQSSGTATLTGGNVVYTASGGTIGPFRYVVCFDDTSGTTATRSVIGWWDYGSALTLNSGETFTIDHSGGILTIA
jgi:hypothetical protein